MKGLEIGKEEERKSKLKNREKWEGGGGEWTRREKKGEERGDSL